MNETLARQILAEEWDRINSLHPDMKLFARDGSVNHGEERLVETALAAMHRYAQLSAASLQSSAGGGEKSVPQYWWDYTSAGPREGEDYCALLRRFGKDGWEACFSQKQPYSGTEIVWFKKPIRALSPMDWQPIETAPNETIILVSGINQRGNRYTDILVRQDDEWCCFDPPNDEYCYPVEPPTHWMPLPEPPTKDKQ